VTEVEWNRFLAEQAAQKALETTQREQRLQDTEVHLTDQNRLAEDSSAKELTIFHGRRFKVIVKVRRQVLCNIPDL
jgi:hypothetical protein